MASSDYYRKQKNYNNHHTRRPVYSQRRDEVVQREARPYQTELLQSALNGNRIIALGTGAGKTHIACMLIREMKSTGTLLPGQVTVFLAPTDALVRQQARVIHESTGLPVKDYIGGSGIFDWNLEQWDYELDQIDVLVMIAQSALNAINNGVLNVSRIGLLIFDECHHARRNHPYREIMLTLDDNFKRLNCDGPRILGLSASIVTRNLKDFEQIEKEISELEEILHCKAITTTDSQTMSIHTTNPTEMFQYYEIYSTRRPEYVGELKMFLNFFLQKDNIKFAGWEFPARNTVEVCKTAVGDCIYALTELGTKPCLKCIELYVAGLNDYLKKDYHRILTDMDVSFVSNTTSVLKKLRGDLNKSFKESTCLSPKVHTLCEILKSFQLTQKLKNENSSPNSVPSLVSGIVFLNRRISAVLLRYIFFDLKNKGYSFIRCGSVVGHGSSSVVKGADMNIYEQEAELNYFRRRETNLLFATNVLEEGLDVPQCNLIVRFDPPLTPRSYIQSKGRARNKEAMLYHMIQDDEIPEQTKNLDTFKRIENSLTNKCRHRDDKTPGSSSDTCDVPPYIISRTGARITGASAIQLVNCYCQRLCRDPFYIPRACCVTKKIEEPLKSGFVCNLILPEKAPIRDIMKSRIWNSSESAKREAHMNTCKKLHELGEINDYLQFNKGKEDGQIDQLLEKLSGITLSDSNNSFYEKKIPSALSKPINLREANDNKFIYKFTIVLKESGVPYWGQENNEQFIINPNNYVGIITAESIPVREIPTFEVYYHDLNLKVTLELIQTNTNLADVQSEILQFQKSVFCEVLKYDEANNFTFSPNNSNSRSFLICPLIHLGEQEWDFDLECLFNFISLPDTLSQNDEYFPKRVVYTKHKPPNRFFHIITVDTTTTLASPFPEKEFSSYADYFTKSYNYNFKEKDYSSYALEAINVSGHINLITSRHKTPKGKGLPKTDYSKRRKTFLFAPQLLVHPIPSTLWRLCVILPSILWRVESFVLILEFIASVERYTGPGETHERVRSADEEPNDTPAHLNYETVPELCVNECGEKPDLISLLSAFTAPSAGDLINYERQEFIGDSLLKLFVTLHVFTQSSLRSEGDLSRVRSKFVSNDTLHWIAVRKAMVHMMRVEQLKVRKTYSPPGFHFITKALSDYIENIVPGKDKLTTSDGLLILSESVCSKASRTDFPASQHLPFRFQQFSDKTSADCIEAVLSSYVCSCGLQQGLRFVSYLDMGIDYCQQSIDSTRSKHDEEMGHFFNPPNAFAHFAANYKFTEFHLEFSEEDVSDLPTRFFSNILKFQKRVLKYKFQNISVLIEAFTHPSFLLKITPTDKPRPSYQRLEFLGDALLDYFICVYTYQKYKDFLPEQLSRLRQSIVNNSRLSSIALENKWYICILSNEKLTTCIGNSEKELNEEKKHNKDFHIVDYLRVKYPKPLGDIVEALIAAVFIDSGFSLDATWDVFRPFFKPIIDQIAHNIPKNPIDHLHELKPKSRINSRVYRTESDHECCIEVDNVPYKDRGTSSETAKFKCAQKAVKDILRKS